LPAVILAVVQEAAEHAAEETSKAPFYIAAGLLVAFALVLSAVGIRAHATFPASKGLSRVLILVCAVLVAGTMATAVITG
jgi:hypothetical protein